MNVEQLNAFEELQRAIEDDLRGSRLFFLEGAGGTGKTFLYKCLYFHLRSKGVKVKLVFSTEIKHATQVLMVAQTGIAATLLINGTTVHRQFGVPLNTAPDAVSSSFFSISF